MTETPKEVVPPKKYTIEVTEAEYNEIVKAIRQVNRRRATMRNYMRCKKEKEEAFKLEHPSPQPATGNPGGELVEPKASQRRGRKQKEQIGIPELLMVDKPPCGDDTSGGGDVT
jgi:hypothetical protein